MRINGHLRRALEEAEANSQPIQLKGPLGNAFTDALNQEYSKTEPAKEGEDKPALESQQMDHSALSRVAALLTTPEKPQTTSALNIYGVSQTEMTDDDIVNVATDMASLNPDDRDSYVIVVQEAPDTGELETHVKELNGAMESMARAFGVKTYPSLEAFAKARFE